MSKILIASVILILGGAGYVFFVRQAQEAIVPNDHENNEVVEDYEIYPSEVAEKIARGDDFILLDVRTPEEYEEVHLKDSVLLPVQQLSAQTLAAIGLGEEARDKEIIIYCRSGARSKTAYDIMNSLGYSNIKSLAGGMIHWEEDGYAFTESGKYTGSSVGTELQGEAATNSKPRVTLDRTLHDFGVIPQYGGIVKTTFSIGNQGTGVLALGKITTSCSCTSAEVSQTEISAGDTATLTVYFDPDFHAEPLDVFKRTVFIPTNDPANPEVEVVVQVDIAEGK